MISHLLLIGIVVSGVTLEFITKPTSQHLKFLQEKGYLEPPHASLGSLKTQEEILKALKRFQSFAGIAATGEIDHATVQKFNQARCGMQDLARNKNERIKRFVLQGGRWHKKQLTYRIVNYSPDLSRTRIHQTIRRTLSRWESASQLRFFEKHKGEADIMIKFERKNHNDPYPFDGPGGTLAHAFYPGLHPLAGDTHFDEDELFTLKSQKGKNFYWVALHEFGHAIGLEHNNIKGTVMYPWYERYNGKEVDLSADDKSGIQALYGLPSGETDPTVPREVDKKPTVHCPKRVQVVIEGENSETIVISHDKVYVYNRHLKFKEGPFALSNYYPGLRRVDTAYRLQNGRTIFLHGSRYWEFRGRTLVHGPEYAARLGLRRQTYNVNAAFRMHGRVYLFKGTQYWRLDTNLNRIDPGYPKLIKENWKGVPNHFDSVYRWNGGIFFFKGSKYYRLNPRRFEVYQNYPMPILNTFLMCGDTSVISQLQSNFERSSNSNVPIINRILLIALFMLCISSIFYIGLV